MSELFLKNEKVLTLKDIEGVPREVVKVDASELLPLCLKKECTTEKFFEWLGKRNINPQREGLKDIVDKFGDTWLVNKNYLSLSDQYWIRKRDEQWKSENYFTNRYCPDVGDITFSPWHFKGRKINGDSPDLTTNGILKKRWRQNDDKTSYLVKAGSLAAHQEPLSEVLVSVLAEKLGGLKSAGYSLCVEGTQMCSRCDNFIDVSTELVPAAYFYYDEERKPTETVYDHLVHMCEKMEIPGAREYVDWMIFIDNLTGNEDRNLGNIGFIRDIDTMKFIGPAPLYDCGNAYWSTKKVGDAIKSKFFHGIEGKILSKMKKKYDLEELFRDESYKKLISAYPEITDRKKEKLIDAIEQRNKQLIEGPSVDNVQR